MQKSNNQEQFPRPRVSQRINAKYLGNGGGYKSHPFPSAGKAMREMWLDRGPTTSLSRSHTELTMAPGTHHSQTGNLLEVWSARHPNTISAGEELAAQALPNETALTIDSEAVIENEGEVMTASQEMQSEDDKPLTFRKKLGKIVRHLMDDERGL